MDNYSKTHFGSILSTMFLVAGCCIGGGMLAFPIATGINGFIPSLAVMVLTWAAMTASALLLLEAVLWMGEGAHIISTTSRILGFPGKAISWILYLFICYASIVSYTAEGGRLFATGSLAFFGFDMSKELGAILFLLIFGIIICLGTRLVGRINMILFIAMVAAYLLLVAIGLPEVKASLLSHSNWNGAYYSIPLLFTAFSFQTIVPSLPPILKRHALSLRVAIVGGTLLAFIVYAFWQAIILGIVPVDGPTGLAESLKRGEPPIQFIQEHVAGSWIGPLAHYFAFFAIVTSFLALTLGLFDFLSDGLKIKKSHWGRLIIGLIIGVPVIIGATQFERIFLIALETTGGYGDSILNGMIPVAMVWLGRYRLGLSKPTDIKLPGGKPVLAVIFVVFLFALLLQISVQISDRDAVKEMYEIYDVSIPEINP